MCIRDSFDIAKFNVVKNAIANNEITLEEAKILDEKAEELSMSEFVAEISSYKETREEQKAKQVTIFDLEEKKREEKTLIEDGEKSLDLSKGRLVYYNHDSYTITRDPIKNEILGGYDLWLSPNSCLLYTSQNHPYKLISGLETSFLSFILILIGYLINSIYLDDLDVYKRQQYAYYIITSKYWHICIAIFKLTYFFFI